MPGAGAPAGGPWPKGPTRAPSPRQPGSVFRVLAKSGPKGQEAVASPGPRAWHPSMAAAAPHLQLHGVATTPDARYRARGVVQSSGEGCGPSRAELRTGGCADTLQLRLYHAREGCCKGC